MDRQIYHSHGSVMGLVASAFMTFQCRAPNLYRDRKHDRKKTQKVAEVGFGKWDPGYFWEI